jgi:hypothetical protein
MSRKFDLQTKKTVHINLKKETHAGFRAQLFKLDLSMQETFEEFAQLVAAENSRANRILEELVESKRIRKIEGLSETEADEIYRMLEEDSPFTTDRS